MKHLLFQIYAPLAAFGNAGAKKEFRTIDNRPTASGLIGLLGAALGKLRSDPWHGKVAQDLRMGLVVLRQGQPLMDYHTIATAPGSKHVFKTRREELDASTYTVQTERDYLSDFYAMVAMWADPKGSGIEFEEMEHHLGTPVFELFAGRKACSLGLPLSPMIKDVPKLSMAFEAYAPFMYAPLFSSGSFSAYWDEHPDAGLVAIERFERDDLIVDRARRLWRTRRELHGEISLTRKGKA